MYQYIHERTISHVRLDVVWKQFLKLNKDTVDCIKYLEIGCLHCGSLIIIQNIKLIMK